MSNKSIIKDDDNDDAEFFALNKLYLQKIEIGRRAHGAIVRGIVVEAALPKEWKNCLVLFRKNQSPFDLTDATTM